MKPGLCWDDCGNISLPIGENDDTLKVLITRNRYFLNPHIPILPICCITF